MTCRDRRSSLARYLGLLLLPAALWGCGEKEERQPTAAELRSYTGQIERDAADERANAIEASRAKEKAVEEEHEARMRAQD